MQQRIIEVCPVPALFSNYDPKRFEIVVVTDVLRASTTICAAFDNKVASIIPVCTEAEALDFRSRGFFVAGERGGLKLSFADAGNSPLEMLQADLAGKTMILTTTNGTQAIRMAAENSFTLVGAFVNLPVLIDWITYNKGDVLVLCAGWQNLMSLEDFLFAGALTDHLITQSDFCIQSDEALIARETWLKGKQDIITFTAEGSHIKRLKAIGQGDSVEYCFRIGASSALPFFKEGALYDLNAI